MTISALTIPGKAAPTPTTRSEVALEALAKAMRQKKQEVDALVRMVEQATPAGDKGQHVNYYG